MKSINFQKLLPKGSVLVFSLLILSIMLVTSLTILSSAVLDRKATLSTGSSTRSFQVADSGVEEVLYQIYKNADAHDNLGDLAGAVGGACVAPGTIEFPVAGGDAKVVFYQDETTVYSVACGTDDDWRDKVVKIKSEGTAGPTTRAVEVAVAGTGGGVAGGCIVYQLINGGPKFIAARWGSGGCLNTATPIVIGGIPNCSSPSFIDSSYSCGQSSMYVSGGEIQVFCLCVEK